jgi:hypothetical protein
MITLYYLFNPLSPPVEMLCIFPCQYPENLLSIQNKPRKVVKKQHTEQIANQWLILIQLLKNQQWDTNQERCLCHI